MRDNIDDFIGWWLGVDPRPIMAVIGAFTVSWGLYLALPAQTFANSPLYTTMGRVGGELVWGGALMTIGVGQLYHSTRPIRRGAVWTTLAGAIIWTFIAVALYMSARLTTAVPVYAWVLVANYWLVYRVRGARVSGRWRDQ